MARDLAEVLLTCVGLGCDAFFQPCFQGQCAKVSSINDKSDWKVVRKALSVINFNDNEVEVSNPNPSSGEWKLPVIPSMQGGFVLGERKSPSFLLYPASLLPLAPGSAEHRCKCAALGQCAVCCR